MLSEKMESSAVLWNLPSMDLSELLSERTLLFVLKVLAAATLVVFGPALVLEYVPTAKVDVRDTASASSPARRTQRLLLAFAGGGLVAEAALHLLADLFVQPLGGISVKNISTLVALGFFVAFAIDRLAGVRQHHQHHHKQQQEDGQLLRESSGAAAAVEVSSDTDAAAAADAVATAAASEASDGVVGTDEGTAATAAAPGGSEDAAGRREVHFEEEDQGEEEKRGEARDEAEDDFPAAWSSVTNEDEGSAAMAIIASARMITPEKAWRPPAPSTDEAVHSPPPPVEEPESAVAGNASAAGEVEEGGSSSPSEGGAGAGAAGAADAAPGTPTLTRYGNPKDNGGDAGSSQESGSSTPAEDTLAATAGSQLADRGAVTGAGDASVGDAACSSLGHNESQGVAEAGAYVTMAVDFLHNVIDGIGIGAAYAFCGDNVGHATTLMKLLHEVQHEVGDVATLVQCGMSKHHAIHVQHTTGAGVFLGVALSLGCPDNSIVTVFESCAALSVGATLHLASGTVLGPVLAVPAEDFVQGLREISAMAAGVVCMFALGLLAKWVGLGH